MRHPSTLLRTFPLCQRITFSSSHILSRSRLSFRRFTLPSATPNTHAKILLLAAATALYLSTQETRADPQPKAYEAPPPPHADISELPQPAQDTKTLKELNPQAFNELVSLLGEDKYSINSDDLSTHGKDAYSYHTGSSPSIIVYPDSTDEVSKVVKLCNRHSLIMVPYGSGTSLEGHTNGLSEGIVSIDVSRMDKIVKVNEDDMDVVVQPGIRWENLNLELRKYGLFFPVDPGPGASIGGMTQTCCSGTNAVRYGVMRPNVINLTVVLPDGTIVKTAQRARKSSAGYSLTSLVVGAEGTLGIVTEITLRLQNIPNVTAVALTQFPSIKNAAAAAIAIQRAGIRIGASEIMDEICMKVVNSYGNFKYKEAPTLLLKFTGETEMAVQEEVKSVQNIFKKFTSEPFIWELDPVRRSNLWETRKGALIGCMAYQPNKSIWTTDVCVPISKLAECIDATKKDIEDAKTIIAPIVGHVGDGNFHVFILVDPKNPCEMAEAQKINTRMVQRAIEMEGTCTGEHGIGIGKKEFLKQEIGEDGIELMRKIKKAIDPKGLMNPNKIFDIDPKRTVGGHSH